MSKKLTDTGTDIATLDKPVEEKAGKYPVNMVTATLGVTKFNRFFNVKEVAKNWDTMTEIEQHCLMHGVKQKIVDTLAKTSGVNKDSYTDADREDLINDQFQALVDGKWETRAPSKNAKLEALLQKHNVKNVDELEELLTKMADK